MEKEFNPYVVLGVSRNAALKEIKEARNKAARSYHPDKGGSDELMKLINRAFTVLIDPLKREEFNEKNDVDENELADIVGHLFSGRRLSEEFEQLLKEWATEFEKNKRNGFDDNWETEFASIVKLVLAKAQKKSKQVRIDEKNTYQQRFQTNLIEDLSKIETFLIQHIPKDTWDWYLEPMKLIPNLNFLNNDLWQYTLDTVETAQKIAELLTSKQEHISVDIEFLKNFGRRWREFKLQEKDSSCCLVEANVSQYKKLLEPKKTNSFFSNRLSTGKPIQSDPLYFTVQEPPQWIAENERNRCSLCSEEFWFLRRKNHCYSCGDIHCAKCADCLTLPLLGYTTEVTVCKKCIREYPYKLSQLWLSKACEYSGEKCILPLSVANSYKVLSSSQWISVGDTFANKNDILPAAWCYYYGNLELKEWTKILIRSIQEYNAFNTITIMESITKLHKPSSKFWIELADQISAMSSQSNNGYLLMFSCYHKAKISAQQLMEKLIICKEKDLMTFLVYYLTVEFELESLMPILTDLIINGYGKIVGLLCSTTSASYQDLLQLVCKFIDIKKFSVAAYLLNCIIEKFSLNWDIVLKEIRNKPYNGIIKCFELFTSRNINPITWLSIISENASNNNYVQAVALCLNLMRIALGNKSWENIIEICCEEKQFDFVPLLVRMIDNSNKVNWENFAEKFITIDDKLSISFYILNNRSWEEIGNNFFNYKFYITALQCYINGKLSNEQLLGKANKLVQFNQSDDALHYYVYLYKHSSFSKTILLMNIYHIISTKMTVKMREDFLKECLLALPNPLTDPNLAIFHYELSQIISEYDKELALQALELACSLDSSWSSELNRLQQEIALSKNLPFKDKLIKAIYAKSAKRVVVLTRKMNSIDCEVAQNYLLSQTNKIAIDQYPPDYGAVLFVLSACIAKSQQKYSVALNFLQKAIFTLPNDDIMDSIELIMEDGLINIKDMMINDLKNLEKSQEILLADLNVVNLDFVTKLRKIPSINTIRKFEQGISNHSHSDLESALLYLDLSMGVDNPSSVVECHLLSSIHFLRAMKTSRNNNDIYSYKQAIFELVTGATLIAHRTVALPMQFHVLRLSLSILLAAIKEFSTVKSIFQVSNSNSKSNVALHTSESRLLSMILQRMFHLAQVTPLCILPNSTCGDSIYMDVITRNFEENWLYNHRHKLGRSDQHYYLFEGVWKGWIDKIKFGEARYLAMNSLLDEKGWNMKQVQSLLDWSYLPRDAEGWLSQSISSLKIQGPKFYRVRGVEIDLKTGVIAPLLEPGTGNKALFGWNDVLTVLKLGIKGSFFTLDQPNYQMTAHPFQAMKYYPPSLDGTHYLATLLHTDYLLKMFSVGVEISALPPFAYKSASKGFLNRLPQPLQQILRPVQIGVAEESAHRFWIEAGELLYDTEFNDNKITFYFSDIPMVVKTHLLERNEHGELVDSEKHSDDTPESVFANNFTENYEAIGQYFPEFLRLKELLKLGGVITIIQNTYHSLLDQISSLHIDEEPIMEYLQEILNNVEYPRNTSYNIDMYMEKVMRDNGICESQLPYSQSSEIRGNIRSKLAQADSDTYSGVKTAIARSFEISESSVQPYIARFLNNSELQSLVNLLRETLYNKKRNELQSVCEKIEILGLKLNKESDSSVSLSNNNNVPCTWVPAVYCTAVGDYNRKTSVYGGINLGLQMRNFNKGSSGRNESSGGNSGRSSGGNSGGSSGRHDENKKAFFEMLKSDTKNYKYTNPLSANNANAYLELAREFGYKHNSTRSHLFEGHWAPNKKDSSIKPPHVHFESKHVAVEDPHCIIQSKK